MTKKLECDICLERFHLYEKDKYEEHIKYCGDLVSMYKAALETKRLVELQEYLDVGFSEEQALFLMERI